jgi:hypothetical protein
LWAASSETHPSERVDFGVAAGKKQQKRFCFTHAAIDFPDPLTSWDVSLASAPRSWSRTNAVSASVRIVQDGVTRRNPGKGQASDGD